MSDIKLVVLDIDGILTMGEAQALDLNLLSRLAELNRRAKIDSQFPAVTINTGRPSAYVEAIMQAIAGWQPALYESGAGLYFPQSYQFQQTPLLTSEQMAQFKIILDAVDKEFVQSGRAYWQPGKTVCFSLFAHAPDTISSIVEDVKAYVADLSDEFIVNSAILALNIYPAHVDKGTGVRWLSETLDIPLTAMAGAGDSTGDIDFLSIIGQSAAPANATDNVKAIVDYVSAENAPDALHDMLNHWGL